MSSDNVEEISHSYIRRPEWGAFHFSPLNNHLCYQSFEFQRKYPYRITVNGKTVLLFKVNHPIACIPSPKIRKEDIGDATVQGGKYIGIANTWTSLAYQVIRNPMKSI